MTSPDGRRRGARTDIPTAALAVLAGGGLVVFAVGLLARAPLTVFGGGLAAGLACLAVAVRRYFALTYPYVEEHEPRAPAGGDGAVADVEPVGRRGLVRRFLVGAGALLGVSLAAPVASLGPRAGDALRHTEWEPGRRLVTGNGRPLRPGDVAVGGFATAWPEGAVGDERSAVIVVRLSGTAKARPPTNMAWVVDGRVVAYSKICTHAGCPVGLFRQRADVLFCPCHMTTFDAARAATPTFGPAVRPLPQLPLGVDRSGALVALGDFRSQVGPAFGWLGR